MAKWVEITEIQRPAAEVAAEILQLRMRTVQEMLPLAAQHFREDIEHVHRLRVSCRRAGAAVQAFRPLIGKKSKRLRKQLKQVRRAAGPARDLDVLLDRFQTECAEKKRDKYILRRLKQQRKQAQPALVDVASSGSVQQLEQATEHCLVALSKEAAKSSAVRFDKFARQAMRAAAHDVFLLAEVNKPTVEVLHQLRIAGKRLRYSIELFHDAFSETLREEVYPLIEKIQSRLGSLNDHATAQALFQRWLSDLPANKQAARLAKRILAEHKAIKKNRADFLRWWSTKQVANLESQLAKLMK